MAGNHHTQLSMGESFVKKPHSAAKRADFGSFRRPVDARADLDVADADILLWPPESVVSSTEESKTGNDSHDIADQQLSIRRESSSRPLPPLPGDADMAANNNNAFPPLDNSMNSPRSPASGPGSQVNGNGASYANKYIPPLPVGHQQDLTFLYQQIQELSGILQSNRDRVNDVTKSAEEVARRANLANGHSSDDPSADQARIRELERELAKANKIIDLYKHEQKENTFLVGQYEQGMWQATEQTREYATKNEDRFLAQKRHYNNLLQQEKDEHLQTRLDREHWHAQTIRVCEMIRTAYRLRVDEWCDEYRVVVGLQSEVRCLRRCLGMEAEKPEEETGYPYLKDAAFDDQA